MFITFEGPDGSGKSTQIRLLAEFLQTRKRAVMLTREPGGTAISEQIREVLLTKKNQSIAPETEALLFSAARAQIVREIIQPALAAGKIVLCDRYADSTMAYQGFGLGLDRAALAAITRFATGGLVPQLTFYIDVPVDVGIARKQSGETNRLDDKTLAYHERVRAGFLEMARGEPSRWIVVDGAQTVVRVQEKICQKVMEALNM